jgi:hypothetical protein
VGFILHGIIYFVLLELLEAREDMQVGLAKINIDFHFATARPCAVISPAGRRPIKLNSRVAHRFNLLNSVRRASLTEVRLLIVMAKDADIKRFKDEVLDLAKTFFSVQQVSVEETTVATAERQRVEVLFVLGAEEDGVTGLIILTERGSLSDNSLDLLEHFTQLDTNEEVFLGKREGLRLSLEKEQGGRTFKKNFLERVEEHLHVINTDTITAATWDQMKKQANKRRRWHR